MPDSPDLALRDARSWPFEEARKVAGRPAVSSKGRAIFETGYGPSGLPHIGTFGEVARTTWVRRAFERLTGLPTRLIAFSDDMDALRKVPDNVPNGAMLRAHLGRPLTRVPDPFGTHESFGHHNNARLRAFLDAFGFEYEFASSSEHYAAGRLDAGLSRMLEVHDAVRDVILPTLGPERRATYSPFLPLHPRTGLVMQVPMEETRPASGTVVWRDPESGERFETPVTGGAVKAQWKADWALRWYALGVDYEMSGKDLTDSVRLSSEICRILGAEPPAGFTYELFLDAEGQKISKSRGNGLTIEAWLRYGPPESLAHFMFQAPTRAKRLHLGVVPRATDDHLQALERLREAPDPDNPAWHVHGGAAPEGAGSPVPYALLLDLALAARATTPAMLWGTLARHLPGASAESSPMLARLVEHALAYLAEVAEPARPRPPSEAERAALADLSARLSAAREAIEALPPAERPAAIQALVYDAGRREPFLQPGKGPEGRPGVSRAWFSALYQVLLGREEGPRFGGFVALYGIAETLALIGEALNRPAGSETRPDAA